ncbi:spermidine/putrescine ABC transporter substrate-binding protein [Candidatus Poribacteria bacterium]|jgi:spermidine/putrescine transport system substrate-binding protein|nr:spermidine/putrescine ABC transporter substrate-binding protein [Candidatus Poribacteria bacterium]MBT5535821.1 spermidine/putrescine ABC transporter substrate-binding protein [Candidatus Poribacteria bacterium]MBT5711830.1 spermidine/putrescine ABC transporter substrate-binding protein [Candidatus Poribacteria bacterium]MBT7098884.1 spermidine/putrescine ABC transporter substrate-binding protein [Candidatus Poribacteria bacterium]MBT7808016.1 spermidine/putrescine ABC transporter substrate-
MGTNLRASLRCAAIVFVAFVAGCAQDDAKTLHVFSWSDYFTPEIVARFEAETGAKVILDTYESNEDLVAKLQAGVTGYDVVLPSDYAVQQLAALGLLAELDKANIPNFANLDPQFLGKYFDAANAHSVPYVWGTAGIGYDSSKVSPAPTSWAALWDEAYAGEINMLDDVRESMGAAFKRLGYSINTTDPPKIAEARALLIDQKPIIASYRTETDDLMQAKQVVLTHAWSGDVLRVAEDSPEWKYVVPDEGSTFFIDNLAIPAGAPHKALAESFINFMLQPDVIAQVTAFTRYGNCVTASRSHLPDSLKDSPAIFPPPDVLARLETIQSLGAADVLYGEAWTAVKAAQ